MSSITDQVVYAGVLDGSPPRLLFRKDLASPSGRRKVFTEAVPILEAQLRRRIEMELQVQDQIDLTVEYDYTQPGLPSHVIDFRRLNTSPAPQQTLTAA